MLDRTKPTVEAYSSGGYWHVRITEAGDARVKSFETEDFAKSYAAGQALRLGVEISPADPSG